MAIGEWVAPELEAQGREMRARAISGGSLISSQRGVWAKDGNHFVNIGEVEDTGRLYDVVIYRFDDSRELQSVVQGARAEFYGERWQLSDVEITELSEQSIATEN